MNFKDFIKQGQVRRATPDLPLVKSLYKNTQNDLKYLESQKIDEISARKIVSNFYDCLRTILEAMASLEGYKIYQHEAFTFFLKEKGEEISSIKFDRFRKIRNKINYYGGNISPEEAKELVEELKKLTNYLAEKYIKSQIKD